MTLTLAQMMSVQYEKDMDELKAKRKNSYEYNEFAFDSVDENEYNYHDWCNELRSDYYRSLGLS